MARPSPDFAVTNSVLDRLIDDDPRDAVRQLKTAMRRNLDLLIADDPRAASETQTANGQSLRQLKDSLRANLDRLLDDGPRSAIELQIGRTQLIRQLKETLRRDLDRLIEEDPRNADPTQGRSQAGRQLKDALVRDIDRLLDDAKEAQAGRAKSLRQLKEALRRDLEWLLNTRRVAQPPDESLTELNRSVYVFGLPDFSGYKTSAPAERAKLLRIIQTTIKLFEPRLANVKVMPIDPGPSVSRTLRLRIEGLLLIDPAPEPVTFDTVLQLTSGQYEVQDAG
jgi:type VI secretion system protein ImpF